MGVVKTDTLRTFCQWCRRRTWHFLTDWIDRRVMKCTECEQHYEVKR